MGFQLCPKCKGDGNLLRYNSPFYVGSSTVNPICDVCNGKKIIDEVTGLPPKDEQETVKPLLETNQAIWPCIFPKCGTDLYNDGTMCFGRACQINKPITVSQQ